MTAQVATGCASLTSVRETAGSQMKNYLAGPDNCRTQCQCFRSHAQIFKARCSTMLSQRLILCQYLNCVVGHCLSLEAYSDCQLRKKSQYTRQTGKTPRKFRSRTDIPVCLSRVERDRQECLSYVGAHADSTYRDQRSAYGRERLIFTAGSGASCATFGT